jgi:hypothetical protein
MNRLDAFLLYEALRLHFTTEDYNYFFYKGKFNISVVDENKTFVLDKLIDRYGNDLENFYIANFVHDPKVWMHELLTEDHHLIFLNWKKRNQSLTYMYKNDIISLLSKVKNFNDLFKNNNPYPILMILALRKTINIETFVILNSFLDFLSHWKSFINTDDPVFNSLKLKTVKYLPFIQFDKKLFKDILKSEVQM